jgi:hypothetical protein
MDVWAEVGKARVSVGDRYEPRIYARRRDVPFSEWDGGFSGGRAPKIATTGLIASTVTLEPPGFVKDSDLAKSVTDVLHIVQCCEGGVLEVKREKVVYDLTDGTKRELAFGADGVRPAGPTGRGCGACAVGTGEAGAGGVIILALGAMAGLARRIASVR